MVTADFIIFLTNAVDKYALTARPFLATPDVTDGTQQGRHVAAMRAVFTVTVATCLLADRFSGRVMQPVGCVCCERSHNKCPTK